MIPDLNAFIDDARRIAELKGQLIGIGKMLDALASYYRMAPSIQGLEASKVAVEIARALTGQISKESQDLAARVRR